MTNIAQITRPVWAKTAPSDWKVTPIRAVLRERKEKNTKLEETNILSVMKDVGVIRYEDKGNVGNKSSDRPEAYKIVRPNDLVLNSMNLSIGSVGISRESGVTSSVYIIYRTVAGLADADFFNNLFQTRAFQRHLASYGRGIMELREAVKERDIRNQPVVLPPLETQKRIADFLDAKTKTIDELVARKERLVELLKEKRAAIITRAVTKGLDLKAKYKPSGVEWLSDIPEGWEVRKIKYLISKNDGGVWGEVDDPEGTPILRSTEVSADGRWRINDIDLAWRALTPAEKTKALLHRGDLLITKSSGSEEHIGKTAIVDEQIEEGKYCYSNFMQRLRVRSEINPKLLYYFFNSQFAREQYKYFSTNTTGLGNLTAGLIGNLVFLLIPTTEQKLIVDNLDIEISKLDETTKCVEAQIEKLKEYRSSLIYSAVTGKISI